MRRILVVLFWIAISLALVVSAQFRALGILLAILAVTIAIDEYTKWKATWENNRRRKRISAGLCATCGYDLRGSVNADVCPECGSRITFAARRRVN